MKNINYVKIALALLFFFFSTLSLAQPPEVSGSLVFLGVSSDSSQSVWLSETTAGSFQLEAQGNQLIDSWDMTGGGTHLSLSPIVSQGNGGTHFLINSLNDRKLDSQNQKGGIVFPPLPSEPPSETIPGVPENPIVIPPGNTPPGGTNPIIPSPGQPITISPPAISAPSTQPHVLSAVQPLSTSGISISSGQKQRIAPITRARQFEQEKQWNIWSDNHYFNSNDTRKDLDTKGKTTYFSIGADRHITSNLVSGLSLSLVRYNYAAFDGTIKNKASGFNVGPYFGYSISPRWATDGSFTYGQLQNNNQIASLKSDYTTQVLQAYLRGTGLYQFGDFQLRPKPLISFSHYRNPDYQFNGTFRNRTFKVNRQGESFNFNFAEFRLEGNYTITTKKGNIIQPYIEPGIDYAFARPNDGQILTGNLRLANTSPITKTLTVGVRTLLSKVFLIDGGGSYLSLGQHGLSVWELKLLASYSFG